MGRSLSFQMCGYWDAGFSDGLDCFRSELLALRLRADIGEVLGDFTVEITVVVVPYFVSFKGRGLSLHNLI